MTESNPRMVRLREAQQHLTERRWDDAEVMCRRLLAVDENDADAMHLLGLCEHGRGNAQSAVDLLSRAAALRPDAPAILNNLGNALRSAGRLDEAVVAFQQAVRANASYFEGFSNLGLALHELGRHEESIAASRAAVALRKDQPKPYNRLALALQAQGKLKEASAVLGRAVQAQPAYVPGWLNLGGILKDVGRIEEAVACFRRVIEMNNGHAGAHSNLLLALHYRNLCSRRELFEEHLAWADRYAATQAQPRAPQDRTPDRPLRVGYVSPYFHAHAVAVFSEPLIASHDPRNVTVVCYADNQHNDAVASRFRAAAAEWRDSTGWTDHRLAQQMRDDRIDVLVDLTGHIAGGRLPAFAERPALVQVTYLGYQNTTGLRAIDYRLTDVHADPAGNGEDAFYTENLWRLERTFFAYRPWDDAPPVSPAPALTQGFVTFGSFNNFAKVSPESIETWCALLRAVPNSRLFVMTKSCDGAEEFARDAFASRGISADRVRFAPGGNVRDYLLKFAEIDIALDTSPFSGHTTTCDALWQGVPVVTCAADTAPYVSRMSASVLRNAGLEHLVTGNVGVFVRTAASLASDLSSLATLRSTMRERLRGSAILDACAFATDIEAAYREMWIKRAKEA
jgi:predicted O-linked N-acetylglucosamine transferase (SPINDLY family)